MRHILLIATLLACATQGFASTLSKPLPNLALIRQMMALDGSADAFTMLKKKSIEDLRRMSAPDTPLAFFETLDKKLDVTVIITKTEESYANLFTEDELKKSIVFYSSPEGKSIALKMAKLAEIGYQQSQEWLQDAIQKTVQEMNPAGMLQKP